MALTCRLATEADIPSIAAFTREAAGTVTPDAYWRWKYFRNPAGRSGVVLACDGDRLVGLIAAFAVPITLAGQRRTAIQLGHNDILKEHRAGGIYFHMAALVMNELVLKQQVDFCFGVAIAETRDLSVVLLDFEDAGPIQRWVRIINPLPHLRKKTGLPLPGMLGRPARALARATARRPLRGLAISPVTQFGPAYDAAWRRFTSPRVMTTRDAAYLEWRYLQCPLAAYRARQLTVDGELRGWVVTHTFAESGIRYGVLDECFTYDTDPALLDRVVNLGLASALEDDVDAVVAWAAPGTPLLAALHAHGFIARTAPRSLIVRRLEPAQATAGLTKLDGWYYTIGDSEYWLFPVEAGFGQSTET